MPRLYDGTSAYKLDHTYYSNFEKESRARREEEQLRKLRAKKIRMKKARIRLVTVMAFVFAVACFMLYGNARTLQAASEAEKMKARLTEITASNAKKMMELEQNLDLGKIEMIAASELGMVYPEKYQIVYVDVFQETYGEAVDGEDTEKENKADKDTDDMMTVGSELTYLN